MDPSERSRLVQIQCTHWFLSTSLFFWKIVFTRPQRGCFAVTESLLKRLSCLQSHYASLIRVRHYVVMFQRSCCSMLACMPSASYPTLPSLSFDFLNWEQRAVVLTVSWTTVTVISMGSDSGLGPGYPQGKHHLWGSGTAAQPSGVCKGGGRPRPTSERTSRSWGRASDTFICVWGEVLRGAREESGQRSRFIGQVHCGVKPESEVEESWKRQ